MVADGIAVVPWRVPAVIDDCACLFSFASLPPLRSDIINAGEWEDTMAHINNYKNEGRQLGCLQLWSPAIIISAVFGFIFCIGLVLVVAGADVAAGGGPVRQKEETNKRGWVHHGCTETPCSSHSFPSPSSRAHHICSQLCLLWTSHGPLCLQVPLSNRYLLSLLSFSS